MLTNASYSSEAWLHYTTTELSHYPTGNLRIRNKSNLFQWFLTIPLSSIWDIGIVQFTNMFAPTWPRRRRSVE